MPQSNMPWWVKPLVVVGVLGFAAVVLNPVVIISAGERGVMTTFGKVSGDILGEGLHMRVPLTQTIYILDVRVQKESAEAEAASKDLQDVTSSIAVNWHLDPDRVNWVYQHVGLSFGERLIDPAVQETVKAVTANYTAVELVSSRELVRNQIKDLLAKRLGRYGILVDEMSIVNFKFSSQFEQAIENKQTAEQMALKAERDLDRIKIEAEQKITAAQAEAQSLHLQKQEITPELLDLRRIEAQVAAIQKWDGHLPNVTGGATPFISVDRAPEK